MKNKISKKIFKHAVLPLITLTLLSSAALGQAEPAVNRDFSTQLPSQQELSTGVNTAQQKAIEAGDGVKTLFSPQKSSRKNASSSIKSLISRFEDLATTEINSVKKVIIPKSATPSIKNQPPVVKAGSTPLVKPNLNPLPQNPVVEKEAIQAVETKKKLSIAALKPTIPPAEELTSGTVERMASLLVSKPIVSEVTEAEIPPAPPLLFPVRRTLTPVPSSTVVQSASDAVDKLAITIEETATTDKKLRSNKQEIEKLMLQTKALEEKSLQGVEKQKVLLSNLKTQQIEPVNRESFLESIKNPHALKKVTTEPKEEVALESETLLGTLKQSLHARRVLIETNGEPQEEQDVSSTLESIIRSAPAKKIVDEKIIDSLAAIEAAQLRIAALQPLADLPLEVGFNKKIQQQNRNRIKAIEEIEKLKGEINTYHKNNENLKFQKMAREEEIASKQQKVLSKLKKTEPANRENFLESIRNRNKNLTKEATESTVNIVPKHEVRSGGVLKSLEEKIKEFQKTQELRHPKLPMTSHHDDDEWD